MKIEFLSTPPTFSSIETFMNQVPAGTVVWLNAAKQHYGTTYCSPGQPYVFNGDNVVVVKIDGKNSTGIWSYRWMIPK